MSYKLEELKRWKREQSFRVTGAKAKLQSLEPGSREYRSIRMELKIAKIAVRDLSRQISKLERREKNA